MYEIEIENKNDQFMCCGKDTHVSTKKNSPSNSGTPFVATSSEKDCPFTTYENITTYKATVSSAYGNLMWGNRNKTSHHPSFKNNNMD